MKYAINNRVDVLDQMGKWLPAGIVDIVKREETGAAVAVRVHFVGYKPKWDETIQLQEDDGLSVRIREIGAFSGAHGWAKYNQAYQEQIKYEKTDLKGIVNDLKKQQKQA